MKMTSAVFSVCMFCMYLCSITYNIAYIREDKPNTTIFNFRGYGGKFKYLTFLNFILQTFYFGVCTVCAFLGKNGGSVDPRGRSSLRRLRDNLHHTLAFPVGSFVVLTFWAIYVVDRELVFPKVLDKYIPVWLNHVMHTFVLPILLTDKYLNYHQVPNRRYGMLGLLAFAAMYLVWILWIAFYAEVWVYPILKVLETYQRAVFIGFMLMLFISLYLLGEAITKFLWRRQVRAYLAVNPRPSRSSKTKKRS